MATSPPIDSAPLLETTPEDNGPRTVGVVLAAGKSTRMGRPKALLPVIKNTIYGYRSKGTFVSRAVEMLRRTGLSEIVVVTNRDTENIIAAAAGKDVIIAVNPDPDRGMVSSILAALNTVAKPDSILMTLVDTPVIEISRAQKMLDHKPKKDTMLLIPRYDDGPGHPVLIYAPAFEALKEDLPKGLKSLMKNYPDRIEEIPISGPQPRDVDTPEDYNHYTSQTNAE